jgi:DNA-directed RNA polymerase specialized sigma24 family protein
VTHISPKPDDPLLHVARAAARGDGRSVGNLVIELGPAVLRVTRRVLGVHDRDAEDVAQEAILAALAALQNFREECSVSHFFCRVAALTALNARRRTRLRTLIAPDSERAMAVEADAPSPMAAAVAARRRDDVASGPVCSGRCEPACRTGLRSVGPKDSGTGRACSLGLLGRSSECGSARPRRRSTSFPVRARAIR